MGARSQYRVWDCLDVACLHAAQVFDIRRFRVQELIDGSLPLLAVSSGVGHFRMHACVIPTAPHKQSTDGKGVKHNQAS